MAAPRIMLSMLTVFLVMVGFGLQNRPSVKAFAVGKKYQLLGVDDVVANGVGAREAFDQESANLVHSPTKEGYRKRELAGSRPPPNRMCAWMFDHLCIPMKCGAVATLSDCDVLRSGINCTTSGRGTVEVISYSRGNWVSASPTRMSRIDKCFVPQATLTCELLVNDASKLVTGWVRTMDIQFGRQNISVNCSGQTASEFAGTNFGTASVGALKYHFLCENSDKALKISAFGCVGNGLYDDKGQECRTKADDASVWASNVARDVKDEFNRLQADAPSLPAQRVRIGTTVIIGPNDVLRPLSHGSAPVTAASTIA